MIKKLSLNYTTLIKWGLLALAAYFIWRCISVDSANYFAKVQTPNEYSSGDRSSVKYSAKEKFQTITTNPIITEIISVPNDEPKAVITAHPTCDGDGSSRYGACGKLGACGTGGSCISKSGDKLLPVLDPCFNMREICKQCILLEDHLFQREKRCDDCIKKHFLTLEALSEESITLDKENKYKFSALELPEKLRFMQKEFLKHGDCEKIAQELRQIRKPLMAKYYEHF